MSSRRWRSLSNVCSYVFFFHDSRVERAVINVKKKEKNECFNAMFRVVVNETIVSRMSLHFVLCCP